jgi:HNH endonuclease
LSACSFDGCLQPLHSVKTGLCKQHYEKDRKARYYQENKGKVLARTGAYAKANREYYNQKNKEFRLADPVRSAAYTSKWRANNPEKNKETADRSRVKNAATHDRCRKEWEAANPDKVRARNARRRARKAGAPGTHSHEDREALFEFHGWRCTHCAADLLALPSRQRHIDHVTALSNGGSDDISNLVPMCGTCNCRKWTKTSL